MNDLLRNGCMGILFGVFLVVALVHSAWVALWETALPAGTVQLSASRFEVDHRQDHIDVHAETEILSKREITDFHAVLALYDCPAPDSLIASCDLIGSATHDFDGSGEPIAAGIPYLFAERFPIANSIKPSGHYVPRLEFSDFQG